MRPIPVPVTLSPHIVDGKPRGFYVIVQSLFPKEQPIIFRQQFVGFTQNIVFTIAHPGKLDTLLKMALYSPTLGSKPVTWLSQIKQYPAGRGLRIYLPGSILKPASAGCKKVDMLGVVLKSAGDQGGILYLDIPKLNSDILLGRKELI